MAITRAQQARQMLKDGNFVMQGGVKNYLGKQKTVSDVPIKWQSGPDKPSTELAYITKAEKDLLLKADIHGSLKDGPNKGPGGLMSLDSFGDDASDPGRGFSGADVSAAERGEKPSGMSQQQADEFRGGALAAGAGPRDDDTARAKEEARKIQKASAKRRRDARRAITKQERIEARENRKRINERLKRDRFVRQERLKGILGKKESFTYTDPITGQVVTRNLNPFGLTDTELEDMKAFGLSPEDNTGLGTPDYQGGVDQDLVNQFLEKSDKFSGAEMEAFKEKFNLPDVGGTLGLALNLASPLLKKGSRINRDFFTDKVLGAGRFKYKGQTVTPETFQFLSPTEMDEIYRDYMGRRQAGDIDAYGNPKIQRDDDRGPVLPILPQKAAATAPLAPAIARNLGGLSPRIGGSIFDFTGLADGGRVSAMDGGIMDMAREEMFLGGIVKGIKKGLKGATRAIKKVAKSPIGKAALLGAGLGFAGIGPFKGLAGTKLGTGLSSLFQGKTSSILNFVKDNPMLAIGGASLLAGAMTPKEKDEFDLDAYYAANRLNTNPDLFPRILGSQFMETAADGGRIGYKEGTIESGAMMSEKEMKKLAKSPLYKGFKKMYGIDPSMAKENPAYDEKFSAFEKLFKKGFQKGGDVEPVAKETMPLLKMGGKEMDLRAEGGFVPIGRMEKADDVPARLSKNEFVFTAEAVRNAGDGDVDKGAEVMYNMMKNLEDGGNVSEESQGLEGARRMFQTSKRLEEVL